MTTLANGSFAIQKGVTGDANIPDGTYTVARFNLSALYGGSLFVDNIAADEGTFVRIVSPCQTEQGLDVKGDHQSS